MSPNELLRIERTRAASDWMFGVQPAGAVLTYPRLDAVRAMRTPLYAADATAYAFANGSTVGWDGLSVVDPLPALRELVAHSLADIHMEVRRLMRQNGATWVHRSGAMSALPAPPQGYSPSPCLMTHRKVLLVGDSTVRDVLSLLTNTPPGQPWAVKNATSAWEVRGLGCDSRLASGCADCWACCEAHCAPGLLGKGGRRSFTPYSQRTARSNQTRRAWQDYVHHRAMSNTTIAFSWKPELFSAADRIAFSTRFCGGNVSGGGGEDAPPDLVYIGKGLHDSCRRTDSAEEFARYAEQRLIELSEVLRCLPSSTLIVLRTPYRTRHGHPQRGARRMGGGGSGSGGGAAGGSGADDLPQRQRRSTAELSPSPALANSKEPRGESNEDDRTCIEPQTEHVRVRALHNVLLKLHRRGAFGARALLLDAHAITGLASQSDTYVELQPLDDHHYPVAVRQIELLTLWHAFEWHLEQRPTSNSERVSIVPPAPSSCR